MYIAAQLRTLTRFMTLESITRVRYFKILTLAVDQVVTLSLISLRNTFLNQKRGGFEITANELDSDMGEYHVLVQAAGFCYNKD